MACSRLKYYLSNAGSSMVALAFVANVSNLEDTLCTFAEVILLAINVLGTGTFNSIAWSSSQLNLSAGFQQYAASLC